MSAPGWYHDPQDPRLVRWYDGTQWTANVQVLGSVPGAPGAPGRKKLSGGAIAAIVIGCVVGGIVLLGIVAAVAIPVFLNQQEKSSLADVADYTCHDVERFAIEQYGSGGRVNLVSLESDLVDDARPVTKLPDGDDMTYVMSCGGVASWDGGDTSKVYADLYVDSYGNAQIDLYES
ncbi:DUF2510 domain-containing protein [Cellulomonas sp. HZM]|uniref:DUF2510 domain-containing protein n=1 Tax=Cellulomonas sp. HZM TaxID=1454010 RepID=UPI0004933473|nr:DUF2510 domain-containing protein [Cellulomonas sp. HZM]